METSRIELKLIACKVTSFTLKLHPLTFINKLFYNNKTILRLALCSFVNIKNHGTPSFRELQYNLPYLFNFILQFFYKNIRERTWTFTAVSLQDLNLLCLPFHHSDFFFCYSLALPISRFWMACYKNNIVRCRIKG